MNNNQSTKSRDELELEKAILFRQQQFTPDEIELIRDMKKRCAEHERPSRKELLTEAYELIKRATPEQIIFAMAAALSDIE